MKTIVHPVILCGGSGSRLWPLSTPKTPKQFLALTSNRSMIEETAARVDQSLHSDMEFAQLLVVGSKRHAKLLSEKLPNAKKILEPCGRNSAPAIAAACLTRDPDDLVLILPADHDIQDVAAFHEAISLAAEGAETGAIVIFGIEPRQPSTGYGYIKILGEYDMGKSLPVEQFVEKPDQTTAQAYLDTGGYFWNAGIFLFKARIMLDALETFAPDVLSGTRNSFPANIRKTIFLGTTKFAATPSISIDYAVMEQAPNVEMVPVSMGWSDVGGYRALHELLTDSETENYTSGPVHIQKSTSSYIRSEGPSISINGVTNLVVVATPNEVMITPMIDDAAVKDLGKAVQSGRQMLGVSPELRAQAREWLWEAFDQWSQKSWDDVRGGFVEQLDLDGKPEPFVNRRVRVQARQVFSFAKAIEMGWPNVDNAKTLVENGLEFIDNRLQHPDGGWVHIVNADGQAVDDRRDLCDHAFLILAGATAFKATGSQRALKIANEAIAFIDAELKDHENGGWFEAKPATLPRRANPHMHLLEAMMAYHDATGCKKAIGRAAEVVRLFETVFFNPATDILAEFFTEDWSLTSSASATIFEPGHHYEWATLLHEYEVLTGHDTGSWRRRLIRRADTTGMNASIQFAMNAVYADGTPKNPSSRLWHQLERFRTSLLHPQLYAQINNQKFAKSIFERYLLPGPKGGWIDEIGQDDVVTSRTVPASMLYHVVTAFAAL